MNDEKTTKTTENKGKNVNIYMPITNYFKYQWTKCSSQKTEWVIGFTK